VLSRNPEWSAELAPFQAEAAWTIGDWETVSSIANPPPIAKVFMAIQSGGNVPESLKLARRDIGSFITAGDYARSYDSILQLHLLREVEMIHSTDLELSRPGQFANTQNANAINQRRVDGLIASLAERFETTLPSFHAREEILSRRRAAFNLVKVPHLQPELGQSWIQSAKIARKAGYDQTAYSAALQAREADAPFAFIQQAKLTRSHGGILKALRELEQPIAKLIRESERADVIDLTGSNAHRPRTDEDLRRDRSLAKATLLEARWSQEGGRFDKNDILRRFKKATELGSTLESPFFHLGRYYDLLAASEKDLGQTALFNNFTCINYYEALQRGVKYIYQTMPRLLTVWLDLAEHKEGKKK
jgi:serine/threonine-protein kinase ATR